MPQTIIILGHNYKFHYPQDYYFKGFAEVNW